MGEGWVDWLVEGFAVGEVVEGSSGLGGDGLVRGWGRMLCLTWALDCKGRRETESWFGFVRNGEYLRSCRERTFRMGLFLDDCVYFVRSP